MRKLLLTGFITFTVFSSPIFAASPHYSIIVDAGSSGSRLHLFEYDNSQGFPVINDIYSEKVSPGLSSFAKDPQKVDAYLQPLFDHAQQKLATLHVSPSQVSVSIMGTAGMRLVPDAAPALYKQARSFLQTHYQFQIKKIETISGQDEGLYGWLDVNFLAKNFQNHTATIGSIDIGGASTQIAFETQDARFAADEVTLKIEGKVHTIFVKSFLGLGQDQAREAMNHAATFASCYPNGYNLPGGTGAFNKEACGKIYNNIILDKQVKEQIPAMANQKFLAYSAVFYNYKFFKVLQTLQQDKVSKRIEDICGQSWSWFQKEYPQESPALLPNYCANAVYVSELLYNTYQINGDDLQVADNINQQSIDWTLGALIHQIYSAPDLR
ncbi:MAG: hypothetical protein ACYCQI_09555 [Gammaproteobacteria bacterium]